MAFSSNDVAKIPMLKSCMNVDPGNIIADIELNLTATILNRGKTGFTHHPAQHHTASHCHADFLFFQLFFAQMLVLGMDLIGSRITAKIIWEWVTQFT